MRSPVKPGETPEAWESDALLSKAQRYFEQMTKADTGTWDHALWSSMALEFLLRGTLSAISPALLADTSEKNWSSLLHSLGFTPNEQKFLPKSIATSEVIRRLADLLPKFDKELADFCRTHTGKRNGELHSGENPFEGVEGSTWQALYYRACDVLLSEMDLKLKDFVGTEEAAAAKKLIAASADKAAAAVKGDVEKHKKSWIAKTASQRAKLFSAAESWASREAGHVVECPSCKSPALVNGEPVAPPKRTIEDDIIVETQERLPSRYECKACGLKIQGLSRLHAVKLDGRFKRTSRYDAAEYYAPEDEMPYYEDDNNEPV